MAGFEPSAGRRPRPGRALVCMPFSRRWTADSGTSRDARGHLRFISTSVLCAAASRSTLLWNRGWLQITPKLRSDMENLVMTGRVKQLDEVVVSY